MKHNIPRHNDFWSLAAEVAHEGGHGHAGPILADWLDEHDSPLRAHIFRNGVPHERRTGLTDVYGTPAPDRDTVRLKDEPGTERRLHGPWGGVGAEHAPIPYAAHTAGPEDYHLFEGVAPNGLSGRFVLRYTLRTPSGPIVLHAPVTSAHLRQIGDEWAATRSTGWNAWHQYADQLAHREAREQAVPLARPEDGPGGIILGPGENIAGHIHHSFYDEKGKELGRIRLREQPGQGPNKDQHHLYIGFVGRTGGVPMSEQSNSIGPELIRPLGRALAEAYPHATHFAGTRISGFREGAGLQQQDVVIPIRRGDRTRLARMRAPAGNPTIVNNMANRAGQFLSKARRNIRDVASRLHKLMRMPTDPEYAALHEALRRAHIAFRDRPNPDPTDRPDTSARAVLADWMEEHGVPGAHILRRRAATLRTSRETNAAKREVLGPRARVAHTVFPATDTLPVATRTEGRELTLSTLGHRGSAYALSVRPGKALSGIGLTVHHIRPNGGVLSSSAIAATPEELTHLLSDFPHEVRVAAIQPLIDSGALRRALRGRGKGAFKLARPDESGEHEQYNALVKSIRTNPTDHTPRLAFADWLQENGVPGAHVVGADAAGREHGTDRKHYDATLGAMGRYDEREQGPILPLVAGPVPKDRLDASSAIELAGTAPIGQVYVSRRPRGGFAVGVLHHNPGGWQIVHTARGHTAAELAHLLADFPPEVRRAMLEPLLPHLRRALRGKGAKVFKLARKTADVSVKALLDQSPQEGPLTLGELKTIEEAHGLPQTRRLSNSVWQPAGAEGDEHPFSAKTENIREFLHHLSRKPLSKSRMLGLLRKPGIKSQTKLAHLIANMRADYEAAPKGDEEHHGSWYHGQVNELERHLHDLATGGKDHPLWGSMDKATGELKGKHNPAENHPGVVLFKALLASTSGSQNPNDNTLSAARAWSAGRRRGHPILDMPDFNTPALEEWIGALKAKRGISPSDYEKDAEIRNPGTTDRQRAQWYNKWVRPHADELPPQYSGADAKINPDHSIVWEQGSEGKPVFKGGKAERGKSYLATLPLTDASGALKAKGWGARGVQVAQQLAKIRGLFLAEKANNPAGTEAEHFRAVAHWLLGEHTPAEFDQKGAEVEKFRSQLPHLPAEAFSGSKHVAEGWFAKGESVPGMFILGPKFGAFGMNLNSNHPAVAGKWRRFLTADLWFTRNWARYLGTLLGKEKKPFEAPGPRDRRAMAVAVKRVCDELGVTPADLQADLWYHEQALYRALGADSGRTISTSYGKAAQKYLAKKSPELLRDRAGKPIKLSRFTSTARLAMDRYRAGLTVPLDRIIGAVSAVPVKLSRPGDVLTWIGGAVPGGVPSIGFWPGGRERSTFLRTSSDRALAAAAKNGQKTALTFTPGQGADVLHLISTNSRQAAKVLLKHGVDEFSLLRGGVHVVDQGGEKAPLVRAAAQELGSPVRSIPGRAILTKLS